MVLIKFFLLFKNFLKIALRPLLPFLQSIRVYPEIIHGRKLASALHLVNTLSICYLTSNFPTRPAFRSEHSNGGAVKFTFLAETFHHSYPQASILYTVSSVDNIAKSTIVLGAKTKGLKIVLNQNGVAYPAWNKLGWKELNQKLGNVFNQADYIIYQSEFCKLSAQKFLGIPDAPSTLIYNPVDTVLYQPIKKQLNRVGPVLLLGGNQYEKYRFESAIQVLSVTRSILPNTRLIITGKLWEEDENETLKVAQKYINQFGLEEAVEFTGPYSQEEAHHIFQRSDILIHTKYNDPSPNLIPEALASGLPVVYSASGGVPELVRKDAGIGIPVEQSWEKICVPSPTLMSIAVAEIWENIRIFSDAARQSSIEMFSLEKFIIAHKNIFSNLLD